MTRPSPARAEAVRRHAIDALFDVRGRVVAVTGGASGIGLAIARILGAAGATVTIVDRAETGLEAAATELATEDVPVGTAVADVADRAALSAALDGVVARCGPLDVVFANAGMSGGAGVEFGGSRIEDVDPQLWDRALAVNLTGVFTTMQCAARSMRGRGGRIVITASIAGLRGDPMVGYPYSASKAAVLNLVRQAALELAAENVLVNAIVPGPFATNIGAPRTDPRKADMEAAFASTVPLGRVAATSEMQGLALYLAAPASGFVTGASFVIDGGSLAGRFPG